MLDVASVKPLGGFRLRIGFQDGHFAALVNEPGTMLEPLCDPSYFARVFLEFGAPTWPNGFDISPEWREMEKAGELSREAVE